VELMGNVSAAGTLRRGTAQTLVGLLIAGMTLTVAVMLTLAVAGAVSGPDALSDKKAAMLRMRGRTPATAVDSGRQPATPAADAGPAADIAQVKADLVDNMTKQGLATKLNQTPTAAEVGQFMASSAAATKLQELSDGVQQLVSRGYPAYTDYRFTAEEWQGVQVTGSSAHALVLGHFSALRDSWVDSDTVQVEAQLALESGSWKLVSASSIHPN
jgi:hypothetical protein